MQHLAKALKRFKLGDVAVRRNPLFYADAYGVLAALEKAGPQARRDWTASRLSEVLWAASRSPYGRQVRGTSDLSSWPLLRKPRVQAASGAFFTGSRLFTVSARTGGTSGAPLQLSRSLRSITFEQVCIDRMMEKLGANARESKCAVLRTDDVKDPNDFEPPYWIYAGGGQRIVFSSSHLNASTVAAYAQALHEFRPDVLLGYPTSLGALCTLLERSGAKLQIPRVLASSEMLHLEVWRAAEHRLGCSVLDYYGQAERVAFAYATAPGEYTFLPGYAHVEFERVGEDEEQTTYEIVGTSLWNLSMPLVRYCTGDLIRVPAGWGGAELEQLALGMRTFSGVLGRDSDILVTPDGVRVTGISHFQRDVEHIERIQVIQESLHQVTILVLAASGYSPRDQERLLHNVRLKLPMAMDVEIRRADTLERTPRGKTPFVIHRPEVREVLRGVHAREACA